MWLHWDFSCDKWALNNACRYDGGATTFRFTIWRPTLVTELETQEENSLSVPSDGDGMSTNCLS